MVWSKDEMCKLAAAEIRDGWYANLGIGLPTGVANHMPQNKKIILHSENGMLGGGPFPTADQVDPDLINAGKQTVSELPYTCYFDSALSFVMLRGGHIDIAILGALQVSEKGDLANWIIPGKMINGVGGAMDIVSGVKRIVVLMEHVSKDGKPKILKECSLPLTGSGVVDRIITNMCIFDIKDGHLRLVKKATDVDVEEIKKNTEPEFTVDVK